MTNAASSADNAAPDDEATTEETARVNEVMGMLDAWKTRIDELRVQVDLAKLDLRDKATEQLDLARNVNQAAASQLRAAYRDAEANAETLHHGVDELLHDLKHTFEAVRDVIARS